jgi:hypothetical protein
MPPLVAGHFPTASVPVLRTAEPFDRKPTTGGGECRRRPVRGSLHGRFLRRSIVSQPRPSNARPAMTASETAQSLDVCASVGTSSCPRTSAFETAVVADGSEPRLASARAAAAAPRAGSSGYSDHSRTGSRSSPRAAREVGALLASAARATAGTQSHRRHAHAARVSDLGGNHPSSGRETPCYSGKRSSAETRFQGCANRHAGGLGVRPADTERVSAVRPLASSVAIRRSHQQAGNGVVKRLEFQ